MLKIVNRNKKSGLTVVKRSNPVTGEVLEFQVHVPNDSVQKFYIEARYEAQWEADKHISMNEETRRIWREAS